VTPLASAVNEIVPDLVVVSGDLTQRARTAEFQEARRFLDSLPGPQLVVPGNHDVPFYDVWSRFTSPYRRFQQHINDDLNPYYEAHGLAVMGLNTARSLTWKNGRINEAQMAETARRFRDAPADAVKILVTHHPLDLPTRFGDEHLVGGARRALPELAQLNVDVLLAGHYHLSHTGDTNERYPLDGYSALVIQAGTTTSSRLRDEPNAFNLLRLSGPDIVVDRYTWRPTEGVFASFLTEAFRRTGRRWTRIIEPVEPGEIIPAPPLE